MGYGKESYFCKEFATEKDKPWMTQEGWYNLLRQYIVASAMIEGDEPSMNVLWLYVPDYTQ